MKVNVLGRLHLIARGVSGDEADGHVEIVLDI